jgi:hypothetical protein
MLANQTNETINISITGFLPIGPQELEEILARYLARPEVGLVSAKARPKGLTLKQAAQELGVP